MAQEYIVNPCVGFNNIQLNEKREDVRRKLVQFNEFKKNKFSQNTSDDFGDFHVYYDENDTIEAIEFFEGNVYLNNEIIFPSSQIKLYNYLRKNDECTTLQDDSIFSEALCISAYAPGDEVESLLIFRTGYY